MTKVQDYRRSAAAALDMAHRASSTPDKSRLLAMAEAWLTLADRAHWMAREQTRRVREHPLVKAKLGRYQPDAN